VVSPSSLPGGSAAGLISFVLSLVLAFVPSPNAHRRPRDGTNPDSPGDMARRGHSGLVMNDQAG
jgi:hypothetical protein